MQQENFLNLSLIMLLPFIAALTCITRFQSARIRQILAVGASLAVAGYFITLANSSRLHSSIKLIPGLLELNPIAPLCGVLFSIVYALVFIAFGKRIFVSKTASFWILIQGLLCVALLCDSIVLFFTIVIGALLAHVHISSIDVYQTSRREDRFILIRAFTFVSIGLCLLFLISITFIDSIYDFSSLYRLAETLSQSTKILSSLVMMILLGAFPLHSWVKPLFAAPARYGLAVITRLNIGFVVWIKLHTIIFAGDAFMDTALIFGCGINLLYAAFLLFGEHKLSQIVAALYLFHIPLLILAVQTSGVSEIRDIALDFANIVISISGLLIILGMLRDRMGAENLDRASGLAISYPFFGISFLFCLLSLIGFPGTLGFLCSEVILHHLAESTWLVAVAFIITLALNGYSSFRIFGESFYGSPEQSYQKLFQPILREKVALSLILLFLFLCGIGPAMVQSASNASASSLVVLSQPTRP